MTVVNINHVGIEYDVYIGRAGRGHAGYFGNPIKVNHRCRECGSFHPSGASTLPCYEEYLRRRLQADSEFAERFANLQGKTLGCFCAPKACHGDVMLVLLAERAVRCVFCTVALNEDERSNTPFGGVNMCSYHRHVMEKDD